MKHPFLIPTLFGLLAISSCSTQLSPTGPELWKETGAGTFMVFRVNGTDSSASGIRPIEGSYDYNIVATGLSLGGKVNVAKLEILGSTSYLCYEANGDFSHGDSTESGVKWITYPTGSKGTIADPVLDTTDYLGYRTTSTSSRTYRGTEEITLGGTQYQAIKIRAISSYVNNSGSSYSYTSRDTTDYSYVPQLGFFGKWCCNDRYTDASGTWLRTYTAQMSMYGQRANPKGGNSN
jgi:hypothetical protein